MERPRLPSTNSCFARAQLVWSLAPSNIKASETAFPGQDISLRMKASYKRLVSTWDDTVAAEHTVGAWITSYACASERSKISCAPHGNFHTSASEKSTAWNYRSFSTKSIAAGGRSRGNGWIRRKKHRVRRCGKNRCCASPLAVTVGYLVHTRWLSARSPGRYTDTWHRNEVFILAEIGSTTSPVLRPKSYRQLLGY